MVILVHRQTGQPLCASDPIEVMAFPSEVVAQRWCEKKDVGNAYKVMDLYVMSANVARMVLEG